MLGLYNTALLPVRLAAEIWSVWRSRTPAGRDEWIERLARRPPSCPTRGIWIHGASVGEARIVDSVARAVRLRRPGMPLAVSAVTRTGREQLPQSPEVNSAFFAPLDFPGVVRRVLHALEPCALALIETELWPNLLHEAQEFGIPVLILNGRLTRRRMANYRRLGGLLRPLLSRVAGFGVQSDEDAARFVELGAPASSIVVTGNVKYDLPPPEDDPDDLRAELGVAVGRPVFVAGSTAAGEDAKVIDAFEDCRVASPGLLLIIAPRHPERFGEVSELLRSRGLSVARLSEATSVSERDVLLVDTVGRLPALYQLASVAFVGGSLVPTGGHNVLEPAAVGAPVLFGPHTDTVSHATADLERSGGGLRVRNAQELSRQLKRLLGDADERARMSRLALQIVEANRGALDRNVSVLLEALNDRPSHSNVGAA